MPAFGRSARERKERRRNRRRHDAGTIAEEPQRTQDERSKQRSARTRRKINDTSLDVLRQDEHRVGPDADISLERHAVR
jgi:hypothetical protein